MSPMESGSYSLVTKKIKGADITAPKEFWDAFNEEKMRKDGYGCGPGKGIGDWIVPDSFWFLCVWLCCAIHDWMYRDKKAYTSRDKEISDEVLLINLTEWIGANSWPIVREMRMYRAMTYFNAVNDGGDSSFWCDGKTKIQKEG